MSVGDLVERTERPPMVRFKREAVDDPKATAENGRYTSRDVDYAHVTPPYSKDLFIAKVETWFRNQEMNVKNGRIPPEWLYHWKKAYEAFKNGEELPLNGTPIKTWNAISPAHIKNLIAINILTVEDLAGCNDQGLQRIGMGARDLVAKAKNWLSTSNDVGKATQKITALEKELNAMKLDNESLREKIEYLKRQD
jgi:hypothetical protein